ncbi:hypothetical protein F4554_000656 [Actinopolymorpha rutila]|uniref:Uncharacterized protein n=1 Tax=Actinopolymorpha rutila TaxID=446787 RepID=A0A852Z8M5_9ACTN|nr:hypothetical protein [Actinopolymorpha rutila]
MPPTRDHHDVRLAERLVEQSLVCRGRVDDHHVVGVGAVQGLAEQALGGRLHDGDLQQSLVGGVLDPLGRAGLRVGVHECDRTPAGGRERGEVDGRGRLADPALQCG